MYWFISLMTSPPLMPIKNTIKKQHYKEYTLGIQSPAKKKNRGANPCNNLKGKDSSNPDF